MIYNASHDDAHVPPKTTLIPLGLWVLTTGRAWLVQAVDATIVREDFGDA